ncbi:MAG: efflux RND transporter periplasmic adaptor subunit [Casimicrobiaceae bacterium]
MSAPEAGNAAPRHPARRKALAAVTALVVIAGIAYGVYWALVLNHYEATDNAYVQGNVVQLTPQVGGTVIAINAEDTDHVRAGQPLVRLDPADARVALDQAEAQLAQATREVRTLYANNSTLASQIALREADLARARTEEARAQDDVARRAPLVATGAVGQEEFNHATAALAAAKSSVAAAQSAVGAAREQLGSNQTLTDGTTVEQHPNVLRAAARVREAYLALTRTDILAPVDGYVAKRSVQLGQRVQAGVPLMAVIGLSEVWVEANFKESQLKNLRIGQPVTLQADVYGSKIDFHGTVDGLGAGTGGAFALLPAQNATGNWIKIVQRVPVRIRLDARELGEHPLRIGLSMEAKVDVSKTDGAMLAAAQRPSSIARTQVFDHDTRAADAEVRRIIVANGGRAPGPSGDAATRGRATHRATATAIARREAVLAGAPSAAAEDPAAARWAGQSN